MSKKFLLFIAFGTIIAVVLAWYVVMFIIKPKAENALKEPLLTEEVPGIQEPVSAAEEGKPIPFTEKIRIKVPQVTTNALDSPESYFQVTIGIIVNDKKLQEQLESDPAQAMIRAILIKKLNSKKVEDVDSPEEKEELRKEIADEIQKMVTEHLGESIWQSATMDVEFIDFLIAT